MEKWFIKNKPVDFKRISQKHKISEMLARLIVNREVKNGLELEDYLNPTLDKMHSPYKMKDIIKAVDILINKIEQNKKIRIVGDYDVDGVISTFLLYKSLTACEAMVDYEVPDRIKDGYGINIEIIEQAHKDGIDTIITCDNGISAFGPIERAKELGMTIIITDHHDIQFEEEDIKEEEETEKEDNIKNEGLSRELEEKLEKPEELEKKSEEVNRVYIVPSADAVINPKQKDCPYPFKSLCGAGVCYKLIEVLYEKLNLPKEECYSLIQYVAIATVCDVVDLIGENRIITKVGLRDLLTTNNQGLKALIKETGMEGKILTPYHIGFVIGPCINASGRLDTAKKGIRLLLSDSEKEANENAIQLKQLNTERKEMTQKGLETAITLVESSSIKEDKVLVVYIEDCHESLAGIIAGRIREKYNKPVIVLTKAEKEIKGSGRSIEEYNMFEELVKCKSLLNKFGGHKAAAGLSLDYEKIDILREKLNKNTTLTGEDLYKKVSIDAVLPFEYISMGLVEEISSLEPYGKANEKPLFVLKDISIQKAMLIGVNKNVLKLILKTALGSSMTGIYFGDIQKFEQTIINKYSKTALYDLYNGMQSAIFLDMTFYPEINEYNGYKNIQLVIQNIRG